MRIDTVDLELRIYTANRSKLGAAWSPFEFSLFGPWGLMRRANMLFGICAALDSPPPANRHM